MIMINEAYGWILLGHLLGASVWTGGHLVLCLCLLPRVLRERDATFLLRFEQAYEKLGLPALLLQVVTGLLLSWRLLPAWSLWFDWSNPLYRVVAMKLGLLLVMVLLALDARLRLIPRLHAGNLNALAWHIVPVTIVSVLFVVLGVSFRTGWFM